MSFQSLLESVLRGYSIVIRIDIPSGYFQLHKLYPERNNVRIALGNYLNLSYGIALMNFADMMPPTPNYNASLLLEMGARRRHLKDLYAAIDECPNIREAIILYRVWARQRDFIEVLY